VARAATNIDDLALGDLVPRVALFQGLEVSLDYEEVSDCQLSGRRLYTSRHSGHCARKASRSLRILLVELEEISSVAGNERVLLSIGLGR